MVGPAGSAVLDVSPFPIPLVLADEASYSIVKELCDLTP
jgi:hypothetical protein